VYKSKVSIDRLPHKIISCQHYSEIYQQNEVHFSHRSPRLHPSFRHRWRSGRPCSSLELSQALTMIFASAQVAPSSGACYCPPVPPPVSLFELFKSLALARIDHDLRPAYRFVLHLDHLAHHHHHHHHHHHPLLHPRPPHAPTPAELSRSTVHTVRGPPTTSTPPIKQKWTAQPPPSATPQKASPATSSPPKSPKQCLSTDPIQPAVPTTSIPSTKPNLTMLWPISGIVMRASPDMFSPPLARLVLVLHHGIGRTTRL